MYKCVEDWSGMIMSFQQPTKSYEILAGVLKSSSSDFISSINETWPRIKFLGVFLAWHYSCEGGSPPWVDLSGNFHIFVPSLTRQRDGGLRAASAGLCVCVDVFTAGWTELGWPRPARPGRLLCARLVAEKDSGFLLRREPASAEKTCEDRDHVPNNDDHHQNKQTLMSTKWYTLNRDKKNFKELSLSLNNCMWFKPNINTGQRSKNGQLKVK